MIVRSKQLVLLVGSNPLPNLVAASLLSQPDGCIHVVHTIETLPFAKNLEKLLLNKLESRHEQFGFLCLNSPTNQFIIHQVISSYFVNNMPLPIETVGLNYTSGMKSMAVHVYEFIKDWCREKQSTFSFSYLDPQTNVLKFTKGNEKRLTNEECRLSLVELLALHGRRVFEEETSAAFPSFRNNLANIAANPSCSSVRRELTKKFIKPILRHNA
jgi:hypothetical protein